MRKPLFTICLATLALLMTGCNSKKEKDNKKGESQTEQTFIFEEDEEYTELTKVDLPCSKELLYNAWKQIGFVDPQKKKGLDYKAHTPSLFISTDLDKDGIAEVLMRGEPPYAAIFTFMKDSVHLVTLVDQREMGISITQDGTIWRSGIGAKGSSISEFFKLENSKVAASGVAREGFEIKNGQMVSTGTQFLLQRDSALVEVSKDEFFQVAPQQNGTYLEDIEGWDDFRKP